MNTAISSRKSTIWAIAAVKANRISTALTLNLSLALTELT